MITSRKFVTFRVVFFFKFWVPFETTQFHLFNQKMVTINTQF